MKRSWDDPDVWWDDEEKSNDTNEPMAVEFHDDYADPEMPTWLVVLLITIAILCLAGSIAFCIFCEPNPAVETLWVFFCPISKKVL